MYVFRPLALLVVFALAVPFGVGRAQNPKVIQGVYAGQWELMRPWLVLQRGMTAQQVKDALGEPTEVKAGTWPSWSYANYASGQTASVTFRNGGLFSWESPRFTTVEGANNITWTKPAQWARLVKGMSSEQAQEVLGVATWVSVSNGNQAWFFYDADTGQNGSLTFQGDGLFSWDMAGVRQGK